jgi:uncharacterized protein YcfJ
MISSRVMHVGIVLVAVLGASLANAHDHHDRHHKKHEHKHHHIKHHDAYGRVVAATPIYREIAVDVPIDRCRIETHAYRESSGGDSFQGTLIGGLIGAAVGKEIGGNGNATAAGGVIGAAIGNQAGKGGRTQYEEREVCHTQYRTEYERQLVGYNVSYRYNGRTYHTETTRHPGDRIRHH